MKKKETIVDRMSREWKEFEKEYKRPPGMFLLNRYQMKEYKDIVRDGARYFRGGRFVHYSFQGVPVETVSVSVQRENKGMLTYPYNLCDRMMDIVRGD